MKLFSLLSPLVTSLLMTFLLSPTAAGENLSGDFIGKISRELGVKTDNIGISVIDTKSGREIVSLNKDKLLNPASNIKILTSYCVTKNLGVNYRWETLLLTKAPINNDTVEGDLYIKGNGDPYMVSELLWIMAKDLLNRGISRIKGDLILDSSNFAPFTATEELNDFESDSDRSFTSAPSALSLNFNSVTVYVWPQTPGTPPKVVVDPAIDYFVLENRGISVGEGKKHDPKIILEPLRDKTRIRISGRWSGASKRVNYRKVYHPELYYGSAFKKFYSELGGSIAGNIKVGAAPADATKLLKFDSRPLAQSVWAMNKFSSNFMALQMTYALGAKDYGLPATYENGLLSLNKCLDSMGLKKEGNVIVSPSGLSRKTLFSASQITSILTTALNDFQISPEYLTSLGIYGEDGTVRKRAFPQELKGMIRVKTGSLTGVDSIAGFIKTKGGNLVAFSIIENGFPKSASDRYRVFQDRIITHILDNL